MVQIRWTQQSINDLKDIFDYISKDSKSYAKHQVLRIKLRTRILNQSPLAGKIIPEFQDEIYRELIEGNYRILYKVVNSITVDILAIHHSARDIARRQLD